MSVSRATKGPMPIEFTDLSPKEAEAPLTSFTRCHLGIVSQLEKTARLPEVVDTATRARKTAADTLDVFRNTVLPHHAEEEAELFPAVLAACNAAERERVQPIVDVRHLGREVVALDAIWVVQEVQGVINRQSESGAPGHESLVDLRLDVDLGHLVEHLGRDCQQSDQRRAGSRAEHHLQ